MKRSLLLACFLLPAFFSFCNVRLPLLFSNEMIVQRDKPIPVWGWADPKEKIQVSFNNQVKSVVTGKDGKWRVDLAPVAAGGPFTLTIKGKNTITISDVLAGEVWLCSGQSNMEMPIAGWGNINNYQQEIAKANYPTIRQFLVQKATAAVPQAQLAGGDWKKCEPANAGDFSAVAYFFARELQAKLNVPIGLINCTWGGTHSETWTSREAFQNSPEFRDMIAGMKPLSMTEVAAQRAKAVESILLKYQVKPQAGMDWKLPLYNDADWNRIRVPGYWENNGLADVDGLIWLRRTIEVTKGDAGKGATLHLGKVDDEDETFVNGVQVGSSKPYNADRVYPVPAGLLKEGRNVIAVRVNDTGGEGGIYGEAGDLVLEIGGRNIPLAGDWSTAIEKAAPVNTSVGPNSFPTLLSNAMLEPLIPYAIKGVIWYQGESNAGRAYQYQKAFPLMITDWRNRWKQNNLPFYFVQLSSYGAANGDSRTGSTWAELREAQQKTLSLPNTGMAVTTDIGDTKDIHPKNKQDVGLRLAKIALDKTYQLGGVSSGPVYDSFTTQGNRVIVSFSNTGSGLTTADKYGYLRGFELAGSDQKFYYAKAWIEGDKVIVTSDAVAAPVAVRYGWADDAGEDNLFNKEKLPAAPFRSDNWKGITEGVKYEIGR